MPAESLLEEWLLSREEGDPRRRFPTPAFLLLPTHTLHFIYPAYHQHTGAARRPVACYLMRVGDTHATVVGESLGIEEKKVSVIATPQPSPTSSELSWKNLPTADRTRWISLLALRFAAVLLCIFIYICALGNLSTAFTLLSSRGLGQKIRDSPLIRDPASALIVGMMATVLLQSSTTFTNVLVSMVAANMITVHIAIPMMIGSELGTSFLNALIALSYAGERDSFGRAFAAAIIGDVFNVCCILIVLPLELLTGFIENISWWIVDPLISEQGLQFKTLELLTDPINRFILEVDEAGLRNASISEHLFASNHSFIMRCSFENGSRIFNCPYDHLFIHTTLSDDTVAKIVLVSSIVTLILSLFSIVWLINSIMKGRVKAAVRRAIGKECPGMWKPCTGYTIMACGFALTLLVQSNSVFTSSLTPIAGAGVISLKKLYALTLGSNMGTTSSGVLAALAADPSRFEMALHMAVCQVIYNVVGTLLFYPVPRLRSVPLKLAGQIGGITARYRWFVLLYLLVLFVITPIVVIGLSLAPPAVTVSVFLCIFFFFASIVVVNLLQTSAPNFLPKKLRSWNFLPFWMHSLRPYDDIISRYCSQLPVIGKYLEKQNLDPNSSQKSLTSSTGSEMPSLHRTSTQV